MIRRLKAVMPASMIRTALVTAAALSLSAIGAPAYADETLDFENQTAGDDADEFEDQTDEGSDFNGVRFGADLGIYTKSLDIGGVPTDVTVFTPRFDLDIMFGSFGIGATVPLVNGSVDVDAVGLANASGSNFRTGNPLIRALVNLDLPLLDLEASIGATVPLASVPDEGEPLDIAAGAFALGAAGAMNGAADIWLFIPDTFSLVAEAKASLDVLLFEIRGDAAIAAMISTGDNSDTEIPFRLGLEGLISVFPFVSAGVRFQSVFLPASDGDKYQASIAPLLEASLGPVSAQASFYFNLDDPFGFSFDDDGIWGFYFGAGLEL
ncbi:MAG: hypothetical protein AAFN74_07850 [Myxococcota bacterium]